MKVKIHILYIVFFGLSLCNSTWAQRNLRDFQLPDLDQQVQYFSDLKGTNLTVIDFWASWCKPCLMSMPKLEALYQEFKDQGVQFIGISTDSPRNLSKLVPLLNSLNVTYPILHDGSGSLMDELGLMAVPGLLLVNSQNEILFIHEGFSPGDESIIKEEIVKNLKL